MGRLGSLVREELADAMALLRDRGSLPPARGFEWAMALLCTWLVAGGYLDAYAHRHISRLETFITPWHAVLYSAMFAVAAFLGINLLRNQARGHSWGRALPMGYGLSLAGCCLFAVGGVLDGIWHSLFGIEVSIAALLSPTHLLLMSAMALIVSGPLRAGWRRPGGRASFPMILSASLLLSTLTFFAQFDEPLINPWAVTRASSQTLTQFTEELGILGIMLQTGLLAGIILMLLRRFTLPFGSLTLMVGLNGVFLSPLEDHYELIPVAIAAGLVADILLAWLKPSSKRILQLRIAGFFGPAVVTAIYLVDLQLTKGIKWPVHLWTGSIFIAGSLGFLLSYVAVWPPYPAAAGLETVVDT